MEIRQFIFSCGLIQYHTKCAFRLLPSHNMFCFTVCCFLFYVLTCVQFHTSPSEIQVSTRLLNNMPLHDTMNKRDLSNLLLRGQFFPNQLFLTPQLALNYIAGHEGVGLKSRAKTQVFCEVSFQKRGKNSAVSCTYCQDGPT